MSYEVAVRGVVIASWGALGAAITVAVHHGARARRVASRDTGVGPGAGPFVGLGVGPGAGPGLGVGPVAADDTFAAMFGGQFEDDFSADLCADLAVGLRPEPGVEPGSFDGARFDEQTRSALAACLFAAAPDDHICWTIMVVDPALHDTPSHLRLIGHYEAELTAVDAADHLADELNSCLVPGEARLTATAIGIEPTAQPSVSVAVDEPFEERSPTGRTSAR